MPENDSPKPHSLLFDENKQGGVLPMLEVRGESASCPRSCRVFLWIIACNRLRGVRRRRRLRVALVRIRCRRRHLLFADPEVNDRVDMQSKPAESASARSDANRDPVKAVRNYLQMWFGIEALSMRFGAFRWSHMNPEAGQSTSNPASPHSFERGVCACMDSDDCHNPNTLS